MLNPRDELIIDFSTSCTKEEAVVKLFGWRNGPIQPKVDSKEEILYKKLWELGLARRIDNTGKITIASSMEELVSADSLSRVKYNDALVDQAFTYILDIDEELEKGSASELKIDQKTTERTGVTHIKLRSLDRWAKQKYGISIDMVAPPTNRNVPVAVTWEEIEIRIRKGNKIAYSHEKCKWSEKTFDEIGLLDKRTQRPNHLAGILIALSHGTNYPKSIPAENKHKKSISTLRTSLMKLTGIKNDPFTSFNKTVGWKPRFKLTDDRGNADDRAKKAAIHTDYDDGKYYEHEGDETDQWIEDNQ
jgi:hypothetical protein